MASHGSGSPNGASLPPPSVKKLFELSLVGDIAANEPISGIAGDCLYVAQVSRVRQEVVIDEMNVPSSPQDIANEVRTYKAGAAGDENVHDTADRFIE
jgi:hypothetical protein